MKRIIFKIILVVGLISGTPLLWAQTTYSIKEMTPAVQSALESRRDRYKTLEQLKIDGVLGENSQGYVKVLKSDVGVEDVAAVENADRKVIYKTIAEQNNLSHAIETIEKVFAQVQREKAASGVMIQQEDGAWKIK